MAKAHFAPLDPNEEEYLRSSAMPSPDELDVLDKDKRVKKKVPPPKRRAPIRGAIQIEARTTGDRRLSWWNVPNHGTMLIFDPHGLRVKELPAYCCKLDELAGSSEVLIIHGGDGTNPLAVALAQRYGERLSPFTIGHGVSRLKPRLQK